MKTPLTTMLVGSLLFISTQTKAQEFSEGGPDMYPSFIDFKNDRPTFKMGPVLLTDQTARLGQATTARAVHTEKDGIGMEHYRYQQTYNGIPVEHATYVVHVNKGLIGSQNGSWVKDFPADLKTTATLTEATALSNAKKYIGASQYKWEIAAEEAFIKQDMNDSKATFYPKAQLVFYSGENELMPKALRLAYKFDIYANDPISRQIVFVDAQNGNILGKREMIHTSNALGTASTAFSGTRSITTDHTGSIYRLRETGRGNGIQTFNMKNAGSNYSAAVDFTDTDNNWNNVNADKDQYATDAHWGAEMTYDYFFTKFNRNSIDNAGYALKSYVHFDLVGLGYSNNVNAFWDGSRMSYGDGNSTYKPLTSLDVAGHEITHGLTERTSALNYSGESGAMNEGFSDIFGTAIEFYARPAKSNWTMGEDIGPIFRSMSNPNLYNQPDTYKGTYWYTGSADYGGVHINSGVLNFWFYLLSQGGSGTNDKGTAYNVTGIGIDKAAAIAFRTNTVYLTSTSNYTAARTYAIRSAQDLYGVGSNEAIQTSCAWAAVGIGTCNTGPSTCKAATGLTTQSITGTSATVTWTAVSDANSYTVEYTVSGDSVWKIATASTTTTSVNLTGLTSSTTYNWRVRTNCSSAASTYATANFKTATVSTGCSAAFEPNETQATAAAINLAVDNTAAINTTTDIDQYKIEISATSNIVYKLVGPSTVDFDLYIYNSRGTQIGSGIGNTATETVSLTNQAAGTYYIRVVGHNGAKSTRCYTINATATTVTNCQSSYDVSTNDTRNGASTIPLDTDITGSIDSNTDIDNYKFVINTAGAITIDLSNLPADYNLKLMDNTGKQLRTSRNENNTSERISYTAAAGTYYAQVYGYDAANNATACYTLKVQTGTAAFVAGQIAGTDILSVYPNPVANVLNINVPGEANGRTMIKVVDVRGNTVLEQKAINKSQKIDVSGLPKGIYLLLVNNGAVNTSSKFVKQ